MKRTVVKSIFDEVLDQVIHIAFWSVLLYCCPSFTTRWWACLVLLIFQIIGSVLVVILAICDWENCTEAGRVWKRVKEYMLATNDPQQKLAMISYWLMLYKPDQKTREALLPQVGITGEYVNIQVCQVPVERAPQIWFIGPDGTRTYLDANDLFRS